MANPLYGQNKMDNYLDGDPGKVKVKTAPISDSKGVVAATGILIPNYHSYTDGNTYANADPYNESSTQLFPLGSFLNWGDRAFRYAKVDGAITAGKCVQQPVFIADHSQMTATAITAVGVTAISVETAGTDITLNQYAEGYLSVNDDGSATGEAGFMKVKSNPAHDHSDDPSIVITTYDALRTALTTASELTLIENPFGGVVVAPSAETGAVVGVTNIDMTDAYYGWIQVRGPRACLADGTLVVGNTAFRSGGTAGAVVAGTDNVLYPLGQVMGGSVVSTEYANIMLNIN